MSCAAADRGSAVAAMGEAFARYVATLDDVGGMLGLGGGGGTSIVTAGMRELAVGVPKVMVSTLAAGDVKAFVGTSDISMMYSVTDVAGLNRISRTVLGNAAHAIAGMASRPIAVADTKPAVALTMFGVTTACVTRAVEQLQERYDCLVFHATGSGGQSMEKLVDSGMLAGVIDVTTTEVCDLIVGGVMSAGPGRLDAIARTRMPYVGSAGALDMVNFYGIDTVPPQFRRPEPVSTQSAGHFAAHQPRRMPRDRALDRKQAQRVRRAGQVPDSGARRLRDRCARAAVLRSGRRTRRCSKHWSRICDRPSGASYCACRCTSTIRSSPTRWSRSSARSRMMPTCSMLRSLTIELLICVLLRPLRIF